MEHSNTKRVKVGDALLAKAQLVDTKPVKARLTHFATTHRSYCAAQRQVDEAERQRGVVLRRIEQLDTAQMNAIEALAVALINEGEPRFNPFERFATHAPGQMKGLLIADEIHAVREVVAAVQSNKLLSAATKALADAAEQAAAAVEAALPEIDASNRNLDMARQMRDPLERAWDSDFSILRTLARVVGKAEAPGLFANLFGHTDTARTAQKVTESPPSPTTAPVAASPPASTAASA